MSTEHLLAGLDGLVRISLKRACSDGTFAIDLDPLSLLPACVPGRTSHPSDIQFA